ncbi:ABC-2 type transport system permease protein [Paenibacillus uliginis N3/975]|uniref:ABC-2 type transport system permease protein n=1 Tax=Paenibacillus uliginis N3/975 TaxID=1313296 RepID=A0A1X7HUQ0_9BACL|nr:ABC transporter permease [Paenibacillus uliginis]SMF92407.1 ABC-2 type transport system permease protein [Paenibacillus uliginis N3/975]
MTGRLIILQCKMELLRIARNPYFIFWSLAMPILFYFIFTRVVNTGAPDAGLWQAHYLISMTTFSVMGSAIMSMGIRLVQEHTLGWSVYMRVTPLPGGVYFFGKMFGQSVMHLLSIIVIFIAGYLINGIQMPAWQWITSGLWIMLASIPFLAIGTLVGAMKRVETASGVSNGIYLALAITGGMWMPMEILPNFLQAIGKWLPSYHFASGGWEIIRGNMPELKSVVLLAGYLVLFMVISTYIRKKQQAA